MLNFFPSAYVTLLSVIGYKVLKYLSWIHMVYLAAQQQNKLIQFPVCANVGVLFTLDILSQACEKHIQTPFSLWQFQFWSITQAIMLCHVSVHSGAFCCLRHRARDPISVAYFDRVSLRSKRFQSSYSSKVRAWAKKKWKWEGEGRRGNYCPQTPQFWKTPLDISRFGSFVN